MQRALARFHWQRAVTGTVLRGGSATAVLSGWRPWQQSKCRWARGQGYDPKLGGESREAIILFDHLKKTPQDCRGYFLNYRRVGDFTGQNQDRTRFPSTSSSSGGCTPGSSLCQQENIFCHRGTGILLPRAVRGLYQFLVPFNIGSQDLATERRVALRDMMTGALCSSRAATDY